MYTCLEIQIIEYTKFLTNACEVKGIHAIISLGSYYVF